MWIPSIKPVILLALALGVTACKITLPAPPSPKTILETQVMGTYGVLEDDLVLVSSVRGPGDGKELKGFEAELAYAKQNRDFNRDDVDELKRKSILGEASDGSLVVLKKGSGLADGATAQDLKLARLLVDEENRDRLVVWKGTIRTNPNLSEKDLPEVRKAFAKVQRDQAQAGHWIQTPEGVWQQKVKEQGEQVEQVEQAARETKGGTVE